MDGMNAIDSDDEADQANHVHLDKNNTPGFFARNWGVIAFGTLVALVLSVIFPPVALVALIAVVASSPVFAWAGLAAVGLVTALSAAVVGVMSALMAKLVVSATNLGADVDENVDADAEMECDLSLEQNQENHSSTNMLHKKLQRRRPLAEGEMHNYSSGSHVKPSVRSSVQYLATDMHVDQDESDDEDLNRAATPPVKQFAAMKRRDSHSPLHLYTTDKKLPSPPVLQFVDDEDLDAADTRTRTLSTGSR